MVYVVFLLKYLTNGFSFDFIYNIFCTQPPATLNNSASQPPRFEHSAADIEDAKSRRQCYDENFTALLHEIEKQTGKAPLLPGESLKLLTELIYKYNLVAEILYDALAEIIKELKIEKDEISKEQFTQIMQYVINKVHRRSNEPSYYDKQADLLLIDPSFIKLHMGFHRTRLNGGRYFGHIYHTLTDLLLDVDACNTQVINWIFRDIRNLPTDSTFCVNCVANLDMLKSRVNFNQQIGDQLRFDFAAVMKEKMQRYMQYYGADHTLTFKCAKNEKLAIEFPVLAEIIYRLEKHLPQLLACQKDMLLKDALKEYCGYSDTQLMPLFSDQAFNDTFRTRLFVGNKTCLLKEDITVGAFLSRYFPHERAHQPVILDKMLFS